MQVSAIKYTAIALLTLFTASSCTVDEDFSDLEKSLQNPSKERSVQPQSSESNDEIIFKVNSGNTARSSEYSSANSLRQFKITAYEGGNNFYNGRTDLVTTFDNGSSWTSDCSRYWPSDRPSNWAGLTFYAYTESNSSNRSAGNDNDYGNLDLTKTIPIIKDFKVKSNPEDQRELMYAVAKDVSKSDGNGEVSLNFKHALCKVYFSASNDDPNISNIEILSIELGGVKDQGSFQFPDLSSQKPQTFNIISNEPKGKWIIPSNAEDQTYILSDINVNLTSSAQSSKILNNGMFLIPQQAEARKDKSSSNGSYFKITIKVTPKGKSEPNAPEILYYPTSINWEEGRSYCYDISWSNPLTVITLCESPL